MSNPDPQPWSPDPSNGIGTAPSKPNGTGTGGERGSSSFVANSLFNANGTRKPGTAARGPGTGKSYHSGVASVTGITASVYGERTKQADTTTVTLAASSTSPAANAAVTFTATLHPTAAAEPTGTVEFREGSTVLGTDTVHAPGDTATFVKTGGFAAGAHTIVARYKGDNNYPQTDSSGLVVTAS